MVSRFRLWWQNSHKAPSNFEVTYRNITEDKVKDFKPIYILGRQQK